jgi:hypothetical protein
MNINIVFGGMGIFGFSIFTVNMYNIPYARINRMDSWDKTRLYFKYTAVSIIKGQIYGAFFPLTAIFVLLDTCNRKHFKRHIKPCSVYFREKLPKIRN